MIFLDNEFSYESIKTGTIIPVNKYIDWTSFDVVKKLRSLFHLKKVGHAGSLDPKATGLLLIATESKTKEINSLMNLEKEYNGIMCIGFETLSADTETEIIKKYDITHITDHQIHSISKKFVGEIEQIPPMHSAVKINGKPLYKLARKGKVIRREPRKIFISFFNRYSFTGYKF
jgi:tRNA pseudouridine55 synthase